MKKLFSLLLFSFIILWCTSFAVNNELVGSSWNLVSFNGTGASGTLSFTENMMSSKFCNNVNQGYIYDSGTLVASGFAMSTKMYCEGLPMTLENAFTIDTKTPVIFVGNSLTIRTASNNIFVFTKQESAPGVCTMEYAPVCGSVAVQCVRAPCPPIQETFSNLCMLKANSRATFLYEWECQTPPIVGGDRDEHSCIASAGYSWSQSKGECVRLREYTATELEKAYDFAFHHGITTMDSLQKFRANNSITRQEAAKMFVVFAEKSLGKTRDKGFSSECNETHDGSWYGSPNWIDDIDPTLVNFLIDACKANIMKGWPIPHTNGAMSFRPFQKLTKAQSLAILMRLVDGWQDETRNPRWFKYSEQAHKLGYIALANHNNMEVAITRGELIVWIHNFYNKWNNK